MSLSSLSYYLAGDLVPDWLLSADPKTSNAAFAGTLTFAHATRIVEAETSFFVIPERTQNGVFLLNGVMKDVSISAATKTVVIPLTVQVLHGDNERDQGHPISVPDTSS